MKKVKSKNTVKDSISYLEYKIQNLEKEYNKISKEYVSAVNQGVGLNGLGILDMLHNLTFLYVTIAAHQDALRSLKDEF